MSRELKRVPVDFAHPVGTVWPGYLMPASLNLTTCPTCAGDGYSPEAAAVANTFYPHMIGGPDADALAWHDKIGQNEVDFLISKGRLSVMVKREPTEDDPRNWEWVNPPRTAVEINEENRSGRGMLGHDCINRHYLVEFHCEALGIDMKCKTCQGEGDIAAPEEREAYENWQKTDPPTGDGYQVWETVSEGSPVSPVFATVDELIDWLLSEGFSLKAIKEFVKTGWAPSMTVVGGVMRTNIETLAE